jgi:hypothetical protein
MGTPRLIMDKLSNKDKKDLLTMLKGEVDPSILQADVIELLDPSSLGPHRLGVVSSGPSGSGEKEKGEMFTEAEALRARKDLAIRNAAKTVKRLAAQVQAEKDKIRQGKSPKEAVKMTGLFSLARRSAEASEIAPKADRLSDSVYAKLTSGGAKPASGGAKPTASETVLSLSTPSSANIASKVVSKAQFYFLFFTASFDKCEASFGITETSFGFTEVSFG